MLPTGRGDAPCLLPVRSQHSMNLSRVKYARKRNPAGGLAFSRWDVPLEGAHLSVKAAIPAGLNREARVHEAQHARLASLSHPGEVKRLN